MSRRIDSVRNEIYVHQTTHVTVVLHTVAMAGSFYVSGCFNLSSNMRTLTRKVSGVPFGGDGVVA